MPAHLLSFLEAWPLGASTLVSTMTRLLLPALLLLSLVPAFPSAAASSHSELAILDAYLATGDTSIGTLHCSRTINNNLILNQHYSWHATPTPSTSFLVFHHQVIHAYESWRAANGHPALVSWNPSTTIPASFATDPACPARSNSSPGISLPTWATVAGGTTQAPIHGYTKLCQFKTNVELGQSLNGWHGNVHVTVGGDMGSAQRAPRDPVFWAWHKYVDDVYHTWEKKCRFLTFEHVLQSLARAPCNAIYELTYERYDHDHYGPGPFYGPCLDVVATVPVDPCADEPCPPCSGGCPYGPVLEPLDQAMDEVYAAAAATLDPLANALPGGDRLLGVVEPWTRGPLNAPEPSEGDGGGDPPQ